MNLFFYWLPYCHMTLNKNIIFDHFPPLMFVYILEYTPLPPTLWALYSNIFVFGLQIDILHAMIENFFHLIHLDCTKLKIIIIYLVEIISCVNVNTEGISSDLLNKLIQVLIMHQYCQIWAVLENYNWVYSSLFYTSLCLLPTGKYRIHDFPTFEKTLSLKQNSIFATSNYYFQLQCWFCMCWLTGACLVSK